MKLLCMWKDCHKLFSMEKSIIAEVTFKAEWLVICKAVDGFLSFYSKLCYVLNAFQNSQKSDLSSNIFVKDYTTFIYLIIQQVKMEDYLQD